MARQPLIEAIRIAPELEREGRSGQNVASPVSDGSAEAARAFAGEFSGVAQKLGALADHAAQVEGKREGHLAGMDPEFRTRQDGTIRGEAFDQAALQTAASRIRVEIHNDIEAAELKHRADPKSLASVLKAKEDAYRKQAPAELVPEVATLFSKGGTAALRQATRQLMADQAAAQKGALQAELDRSLKTIQQRAYGGGLDQAAIDAVAGDVASLERSLGRRGPDGQRLVDPGTATRIVTSARETVVMAQVEGAFDRLPDAEAKRRFIERFDQDFGQSQGPASTFDFKTFEATKRKLEAQLTKDESRARQANGALAHMVKEVERRSATGEPVRSDEIAQLGAAVATRGTPELQAQLDDALDSLQFQQTLKVQPLPAIEQAVDQMRQALAADPSTIADRGRIGRRLKAAEATLEKAKSEIVRDPLAWDGRTGMTEVQPLATVKLDDPGALEAWGATRTGQAEEAARRHGLGRPVFLQPVEKRFVAKQLEQGGQEALAAVTGIRRAFGDRAEDVLREVGKDAPAGVVLADLALKTGMTPAVMDAAEGLAMKTKPGHRSVAPPAERAKIAADGEAGAALGRAPTYMSQAMRLADAIYERRAYRDGKIEAFDEGIWKQAFREALGEHEVGGRTYGGLYRPGTFLSHKIVLPPTMPQDKAGAILAAITPDDLGAAEGAGPKRGTRTLTSQELRGATLVTVAPGRYLVALGSATSADPKWAVDDRGRAYVLDLEAAASSIRRRRPDLR
jgi:hypothetical protein